MDTFRIKARYQGVVSSRYQRGAFYKLDFVPVVNWFGAFKRYEVYRVVAGTRTSKPETYEYLETFLRDWSDVQVVPRYSRYY